MNEPQQSTVDRRLVALLDSLRKTGQLDLGELNWYAARRAGIEGVVRAPEAEGGVATRTKAAVLSRVERRTIEKILSAHGVDMRATEA